MTEPEQTNERDESAAKNDMSGIPLRDDRADQAPEDAPTVWAAYIRHDESGQRMGHNLFDNQEAAIEYARTEFRFYFDIDIHRDEFEQIHERAWQYTLGDWTARAEKTRIYSASDEVPSAFRINVEESDGGGDD